MTKTDFIHALAQKTGLSKIDATRIVEAYAEVVIEGLKAGDDVTLPGLVKLDVKATPEKPEREGINPFTRQPVTIKAKPASKKVKASPVAALKKAVV